MSGASPPLAALARGGPHVAARLLGVFALYAAALELGVSSGLVGAVSSPVGVALLGVAGVLLVVAAVAALATPPRRLSRVAVFAGAGLALAALPLSLATRDAQVRTVVEGEALGPSELPGLPELRFGRTTLLPRGPGVLSKTVSIPAERVGAAPLTVGLFPPTMAGRWRLTIYRFGYAPSVEWRGPDGRLRGSGRIPMGTISHDEEEASLVTWTPEPNVMMGAGTFPPKLEELVAGAGGSEHVFLRIEEATLGGIRRDLTDPDAYRWLADGRPEDPVFRVRVLRGREVLFEGRVRGGETLRFGGGELTFAPDVALWVDVFAAHDPWLPLAGLGLVLLALGVLGIGVGAAIRSVRRAWAALAAT